MSILEVKKINKSFGKKQVLKNVSLSINEGEILGFIGPNGAGKTTTIKVILGLQSLDSGEVFINGYDLVKDFTKAIEKVGAIVENPDLYMYLSGRKNLELIANMYENVSKEKIDELVKLVGLENRINDKVSKYSLGMRQRLGIAAALLNDPNLLILDEPTNGLDPEGIKELRDILKDLARSRKIAILISSHNLMELQNFCSDVCIIRNGEVIDQKKMKDFRKTKESEYIFEVNDINLLNKVIDNYDVIGEKRVKFKIEKNDIPAMIEKMIENNIKVYEVTARNMSLEEAFLTKTGGNKID
jgi:ABC-2 type transport system ATP-binding protein